MGIPFIIFIAVCALIYIKNVEDVEEDRALIIDNELNQLLIDGVHGMLILMIDDEVNILNEDGIKVDINYIKPGMRINFRYKSDIIDGCPGIVKKVFEIIIFE